MTKQDANDVGVLVNWRHVMMYREKAGGDSILTHQKQRDVNQFRTIFAVSFVLFFLVALCGRLLPRSWRFWLVGTSSGYLSITEEAKLMVNSSLPYAF